VRDIFSWKGLKRDVLHHVRDCMTCQHNKSEFTHPVRLLQPFSILEQKWDNISMEFIIGFPKVQGRDYIYVVVDRLTKYVHFFSYPSEYNISQVADLFFREVFRLHGLPRNIVSDQDNMFLNTFW
jgi:hypothetical protein